MHLLAYAHLCEYDVAPAPTMPGLLVETPATVASRERHDPGRTIFDAAVTYGDLYGCGVYERETLRPHAMDDWADVPPQLWACV